MDLGRSWPTLTARHYPHYTTSQRRTARLIERWLLERDTYCVCDLDNDVHYPVAQDPFAPAVEDLLLQMLHRPQLEVPYSWVRPDINVVRKCLVGVRVFAGEAPTSQHRIRLSPATTLS